MTNIWRVPGELWERIEAIFQEHDPPRSTRYSARRWFVERTLGWLSKCRAISVRYEKKASNCLGLVKVACILHWYRRLRREPAADPARFDSNPRVKHSGSSGSGRGWAKEGEG